MRVSIGRRGEQVLDAFLEIGEIQCFQINKDPRGLSLNTMVENIAAVDSL